MVALYGSAVLFVNTGTSVLGLAAARLSYSEWRLPDDGIGRCRIEPAAKGLVRKEMNASPRADPTPILWITRLSFLLFIPLGTITGAVLFLFATRTADLFAWTIAVPMSAAFLGAAYWAFVPGLLLALRDGAWPRSRVLVPAGFTVST